MRILAIIVTYNGIKWIDKCISSLLSSSLIPDIYVIDNCSSDGTEDYIAQSFPSVILINSKINLGFAKANNIGLRYALDNNYDFVLLLNQDAWVEADTIECLAKTFVNNEGVGISSPIHLNGSKTTLDYGFANYVDGDFVMDLYRGKLKPYYQVPFVNAAAWLISRECLEKVGGFDTLLFYHYEEDQNYCQRIKFHGFKLVINTECTICHDREKRVASSYEGRLLWENKNKFSWVKLDWGNINRPFNTKQKKGKNVIRIICFSILFQFNKVRNIIEENKLLSQIKQSRIINTSVGPSWL